MITKKDIKLIVLIASTLILTWFCYLLIKSLFYRATHDTSTISELTKHSNEWLNSYRKINYADLKNRIIILNFLSDSCVNCLDITSKIQNLEEEFGKNISIINIYSPIFNHEKETDVIKKSIIRNDIYNLVINDKNYEIYKKLKISSLPTVVLIDYRGKIVKKYQNDFSIEVIKNEILNLISNSIALTNKNLLPISLEKYKNINYFIGFPSSLEFAKSFSYKNIIKTSALIISNSAKNNILITTLDGEILLEIGSNKSGNQDGIIENASFNSPHGILFKNDILYVADTKNHSIRKVDFKNDRVSTIAGTKIKGSTISQTEKATDIYLSSPWDLEFFPNNKNITISNAGSNQLLRFDLTKNTITPYAGNGKKESTDGEYPNNSLAQPLSISVANEKLYFVDSLTSSLRVMNKNGKIETLITKNDQQKNPLQYPSGLSADDTGVYIANTYKNRIEKFDFTTKKLSVYSDQKVVNKPENQGNSSYYHPEGIISVLDKFYIADTNNGRIIELERNLNSKLFNILPRAKFLKDSHLEYLFNLSKSPSKIVKYNETIDLICKIDEGWKINKLIESSLKLFEIKNNQAILVAHFNDQEVRSGLIKLQKLSKKSIYYIQGSIYYCQDKQNGVCLVNNFEKKLIPEKFGDNKIKVEFIYESL